MLPHEISNLLSTPITALVDIIQGFHLFPLRIKTKLLRKLLNFADSIIVGCHRSHSTFSKLLSFTAGHARLGCFQNHPTTSGHIVQDKKKSFYFSPRPDPSPILPPLSPTFPSNSDRSLSIQRRCDLHHVRTRCHKFLHSCNRELSSNLRLPLHLVGIEVIFGLWIKFANLCRVPIFFAVSGDYPKVLYA